MFGAALLVAACGAPPARSDTAPAAAVSEIALKPGDLDPSWVVCSQSGDLERFAAAVAPLNASSSESLAQLWLWLRTEGATDSWLQVLSDGLRTCDSIVAGRGAILQASTLVLRFASEGKALAAYGNGIATQGPLYVPSLMKGRPGVTQGWATGLGPSSTVFVAPQLYIGLFESRGVVVFLVVRGTAVSTAQTAATRVFSRIG